MAADPVDLDALVQRAEARLAQRRLVEEEQERQEAERLRQGRGPFPPRPLVRG